MSKLTDREQEIIKILKTDPMISQEDLAEFVGITRSAVAVHISNLIKKGHILGRGYVFNEKTGILVVGSLYFEVEAVLSVNEKDQINLKNGGPGFEISSNLAMLDVPVSLVSVVGRDNWGEAIITSLKEAGVDTRYLVQSNELPTPRRVLIVEDRSTKKVVSDSEALEKLEYVGLHNIAVAVANAGMVVAEADLPEEAIRQLSVMARNANIRLCLVFFDGQDRGFQEHYEGTFMTVLSGLVAERLSGVVVRNLDDATQAGRILVEKGIEWVTIVLPGEGISITGKDEGHSLPLLPGHAEGEDISLSKLTAGLISGFFKGYELRQNARLSLGLAANPTGKGRDMSKKKEKD